MNRRKEHKYLFRIVVVILIVILVFVSFFMLSVHLPYFNYHNDNDKYMIEILKDNNLTYDHYFYEYRGKETYYTIKVKVNNQSVYQAYNDKKKLLASYSGEVADKKTVIKAMNKKYKIDLDDIQIVYDNGSFYYYGVYQDDNHLYYIYYSLDKGEFVKHYRL